MKKLTYCTLALVVLSFSTISAMKANIVTNRSNIRLTLGEKVNNLSLSEEFREEECNGYRIILKKKENNIKMKLSDKGNNIMKLLLTESGDVYLYHTNWNSSLDISCNGTLNLFSYLRSGKKDSRKTFSCNRFEGKGNDVYIWGDVYVQNYWSFKGDTVCIAGRFRNKGANDVLNTPSKEQADNLKKNYLSKLSRGFWVLGTTDVSSIMTHNLNTHIVGTLQSPSLSQKGYARELSVGRENFTDEFFADFNECYSIEQEKTQFSTEKLSGAEKVTVNVKENTKVKIDNMDCRPEIKFKGNQNLEGDKEGRKISIKYNETFEVKIENIDDRITIYGVKLKEVQKKIEPSPKVGLKSSQGIDEPRGIANIGNACFANAAFQLILSSENMRNIYLSYNGNDDFMKAMKTLVTMWIGIKNVTSPINIRTLVKDIWPDSFKGNGEVDGQQHDSGEFLLHLLQKTEKVVRAEVGEAKKGAKKTEEEVRGSLPFIGEEVVNLFTKGGAQIHPKTEGAQKEETPFIALDFLPKEISDAKGDTKIGKKDLCELVLRTEREIPYDIADRIDEELKRKINISEEKKGSFSSKEANWLEETKTEEQIEVELRQERNLKIKRDKQGKVVYRQQVNVNRYYITANKITTRTFTPKCLFINIERRDCYKDNEGVLHYKNDTTSINIPEILTLDDSADYALKGFVCHSGDEEGTRGHYVAYTRPNTDWFRISDSSVQPGIDETNKNKESTILLYEQVERSAVKKMK